MSYGTTHQLYLIDETDDHSLITPKQLAQMIRDPRSWENYLAAILGGPAASMTAVMQDGEKVPLKVLLSEEEPVKAKFNEL